MIKNRKTALVTGGAGYIGSHCVERLAVDGWDAIVIDDLSTGHEKAVLSGQLVKGGIGDANLLDTIFSTYSIDAVLHFAGSSYVGESVKEPDKYYKNNVSNGLILLSAMIRNNVRDIVFSSSCAVYGIPEIIPIPEDCPKNPVSPYGFSKMVFERMALDFARSDGLRPVFLRYFNAAGADPDGRLGEDHDPETHLIPLAIKAALGQNQRITIFGADYPTGDGTCVRDYIHILDLAEAHIKAIDYIKQGGEPAAFNLGNGSGYSVRQVIKLVEKISGKRIAVKEGSRRDGDPPVLTASSEHIDKTFGLTPKYPHLESIVETAYRWHKANPGGFGS
ncbi:MAG TPA: UDP-glucose 4-epimerase GalE [Nitrospirae bacterium]|nr:UDP-glucose 4-epimerase GalE [Nitrospirota bacterium]